MAFSSKFGFAVLLLVLFCLLVLSIQKSSADCIVGKGCRNVRTTSQVAHGRKLLGGMYMNKMNFKNGVDGPLGNGNGKKMVMTWELREAPLGPDPLHHNGVNPSKPRTTP